MTTEQPRHPALPPKAKKIGKRIPTNEAMLLAAPWMPADYKLADVSAVQALARGDASPDMQRRALDWIIHHACKTYDFPFRPGPDDRDTNIALGRAFAGQQIVKLLKVNVAALARTEQRADPPEG